jgi:two-component system, chemotaxis family, CheB/CheR fusion protein
MLDLSWLLRRHKGCPCFTNRSPSSVSAAPQAALKRWKSCSRTCRRTAAWPFVLVTHLPVGYETSLPDILGRHSAMAVTIAGNGEAIEPNHVYVCPSGSTLTVNEGRLVLSLLGSAPVPNLVDALLYSLAEDQMRGY